MKKRVFAFIALLVTLVLLTCSTGVLADFGGFSGDSDYSGSWGSDSGSSSWGWDIGGDDSGPSWFFFGGSDDDYDGRGVSCQGDAMMIVIIIVVIILVILIMRNARNQQPTVTTGVARTDDSMLTPMDQYTANVDPEFSVAQMQTKLANLYVQLQDCWSARDLTPLRPYLTDELYNQTERQVEEMKKLGQTPHVERISVLGTNLRGYFVRDGMDHIIVEMTTRICTYATDDKTEAVVMGDPKREKFMTYEWDLCRTSGQTTAESEAMHSVNCPNCGAPVTINKSAKCPYCETVITLDEHDWVLYSIKGLSQQTI